MVTREELFKIDELGLNDLVAERIMKWPQTKDDLGNIIWTDDKGYRHYRALGWKPSTDRNDAIKVIEKLETLEVRDKFGMNLSILLGWDLREEFEPAHLFHSLITADPKLLMIAALIAVSPEEGKDLEKESVPNSYNN